MRVQCVQLRGAMAKRDNYGEECVERARQLYMHDGLSPKAIGERLNVPPATVKSWRYRYGWRRQVDAVRDALNAAVAEQGVDLAKRRAAEIVRAEDEGLENVKLLQTKALGPVVRGGEVGSDEIKTISQTFVALEELKRKILRLDSKTSDNSPKTLVNISMAPGSNLTSPIGRPIEAQPIDVAPLEPDSDL